MLGKIKLVFGGAMISLLLLACTSSKGGDTKISVEVFCSFEEFQPLLRKADNTIYILNFWATWCKPCVDELPDFERINKNFKRENVKLILVSLDDPKDLKTKVIPFLRKNNISSETVLLDDVDFNSWISKVSLTWSGSIPATLIYHKNKRKFYEKSLTYSDLKKDILSFKQ